MLVKSWELCRAMSLQLTTPVSSLSEIFACIGIHATVRLHRLLLSEVPISGAFSDFGSPPLRSAVHDMHCGCLC